MRPAAYLESVSITRCAPEPAFMTAPGEKPTALDSLGPERRRATPSDWASHAGTFSLSATSTAALPVIYRGDQVPSRPGRPGHHPAYGAGATLRRAVGLQTDGTVGPAYASLPSLGWEDTSVLAGIKVVLPVGSSTLTPAAARQARRVSKAGRFVCQPVP